jgi:RNA recognition motif-containing protein
MSKTLYVGNLSLHTTQEEIRKLFEQYGKIMSIDLVTDDRYFDEHRGSGFVTMADQGARKAIQLRVRGSVNE